MKDQKKNTRPQDSSPEHNPQSVEDDRDQTTMADQTTGTKQKRFPWATLIIILLLILIVGAIFLLARA